MKLDSCTVLSHNAGLFSIINKVMVCMDIYEKVAVDFTKGDHHPYEFGTKDLWEELFEPVSKESGTGIIAFPDMWLTAYHAADCYLGDQSWRKRFNEYWNSVKVRQDIRSRVDEYISKHVGSKSFISAMVRSDYHGREQISKSSAACEKYAEVIRNTLLPGELIYVAAGDHQTIQWFQEHFDNLIVYHETRRTHDRSTDLIIHYPQTIQDAVNCMIEVLIMSRGRALIHQISNMATAVLYMNPNLKSVFMP